MHKFFVIASLFLSSAVCACSDCDSIKDEARELRDGYERCSAGDTCEVVNLYDIAGDNTCLGAFQCSAAFRQDADLEAFRSRARSLAADYSGCSECVQAGCVDPGTLQARCNEAIGRCELVMQ